MNERKTLLLQLIQQPLATETTAEALRAHDQVCEQHIAEVTKQDVLAALKLFAGGQLTPQQLEGWARSLHGRMDVGYEFGESGVVEEAMFWLANPSLNWPINEELRLRIIHLFERRSHKRD